MNPFLVDSIGATLNVLSYISVFPSKMLRPRFDKESWGAVVEAWVTGNLLMSIVLLATVPTNVKWVHQIVTLYILLRIIEIVVFQFNSQIYGGYPGKDRPRLHYTVLSYRRSIFLAGLLYVEVIMWFACVYRLYANHFTSSNVSLTHPLKALYYSVVTMTTIGYGDVSAITTFGFGVVIAQALIGIFMTLLILARLVSYLPRPDTLDPIEKQPAED